MQVSGFLCLLAETLTPSMVLKLDSPSRAPTAPELAANSLQVPAKFFGLFVLFGTAEK